MRHSVVLQYIFLYAATLSTYNVLAKLGVSTEHASLYPVRELNPYPLSASNWAERRHRLLHQHYMQSYQHHRHVTIVALHTPFQLIRPSLSLNPF